LPVVIYPAQVQGEAAPASLIAALASANARAECDVLILARGGGSLEDLSAFNDETLARAIRASAIPVVTGVGHEIDISIADLVADRRAATPSAAAELVAPSGEHLRHRLAALVGRLDAAQARRRMAAAQRLNALVRHLALLHPAARLEQRAQRLDQLEQRLVSLLSNRLGQARARLRPAAARLSLASPGRRLERIGSAVAALEQRLVRARARLAETRRERLMRAIAGLEARSPLATIARGYAIVTRLPEGEIVRAPEQAPPGTRIEARLAKGKITAVVE
jgi:exodeoxyribonuclease VII large subunit